MNVVQGAESCVCRKSVTPHAGLSSAGPSSERVACCMQRCGVLLRHQSRSDMYYHAPISAFHAKSYNDLIFSAGSTGVPAAVTDSVLQEARHWFNLPVCVLDFFDICIHLTSLYAKVCILPSYHFGSGAARKIIWT